MVGRSVGEGVGQGPFAAPPGPVEEDDLGAGVVGVEAPGPEDDAPVFFEVDDAVQGRRVVCADERRQHGRVEPGERGQDACREAAAAVPAALLAPASVSSQHACTHTDVCLCPLT